MPKEERNPVLHRLDALAGEWAFEATTTDGQPAARGRASFEWLDGDGFLVARADAEPPTDETPQVWVEHSPFPTVAVLALDDPSGRFTYAYADARAVSRVYEMSFDGGTWKVWGQAGPDFAQRFGADVSDDAIRGRWERSTDGEVWETDFDIVYTRV